MGIAGPRAGCPAGGGAGCRPPPQPPADGRDAAHRGPVAELRLRGAVGHRVAQGRGRGAPGGRHLVEPLRRRGQRGPPPWSPRRPGRVGDVGAAPAVPARPPAVGRQPGGVRRPAPGHHAGPGHPGDGLPRAAGRAGRDRRSTCSAWAATSIGSTTSSTRPRSRPAGSLTQAGRAARAHRRRTGVVPLPARSHRSSSTRPRWRSGPARRWRSWAGRDRASRPSPTCCSGCTSPRPGASSSTATTWPTWMPVRSGARSAS